MSAPVYILGGYQSDFAKSWARQGQDISDMVQEATQGVLNNAGLHGGANDPRTLGRAGHAP
jgi:acetyl-CoA C-acetyltransferase